LLTFLKNYIGIYSEKFVFVDALSSGYHCCVDTSCGDRHELAGYSYVNYAFMLLFTVAYAVSERLLLTWQRNYACQSSCGSVYGWRAGAPAGRQPTAIHNSENGC